MAVDGVGADTTCFRVGSSFGHTVRMGDLGVGRAEGFVGERHLARVDAAFADVTEAPRKVCLGAKALGIGEVGAGRIICEHTGLSGCEPHLQHDRVQRGWLVAIDLQRFEQVAQAQLQAGHARMRAGELVSEPKAACRLDIQQQPHRLGDAVSALGRFLRTFCLLFCLLCRFHVCQAIGRKAQMTLDADTGARAMAGLRRVFVGELTMEQYMVEYKYLDDIKTFDGDGGSGGKDAPKISWNAYVARFWLGKITSRGSNKSRSRNHQAGGGVT